MAGYIAIVNNYPEAFFILLEKDNKENNPTLLRKSNCYFPALIKQKDGLPMKSKERFFNWLLVEGKAQSKPVERGTASERLTDFYCFNYYHLHQNVKINLTELKYKVCV